jgi:Xaa-Pro aminopeptidase
VPEIHARRRARLRQLVHERGADALLVTSWVNVRYLTGFTGSLGGLLLTPDDAVLVTDGRYTTQARAQAPDVERVIDRDVLGTLSTRAERDGRRGFGVEEHVLTLAELDRLQAEHPRLEVVRTRRAVESLRVVKDPGELEALRTACQISDEALARLCAAVRPGRSELALARELDRWMADLGAEGPGFDTIVAAGPNSAIPHHRPTDRLVASGDLLKIDFGARVDGYHADCTRTFVVGRAPAGWQADLHALVFAAQRAGREALCAGAAAREVDAAARAVIEAAGQGEAFPHGLGHGVGLEIHEDPYLGARSEHVVPAGAVVTVEPGVYLPGRGGVRIEDTLSVGSDTSGGVELLTASTKELLVLG